MIKLLASYNEKVNEVVLENAPQNARYTSPTIQKEILHIFARKVQDKICNEIGNAKFCLIVNEARDESKREQMALLVRFVDKHGLVKEHFLDVAHVIDTTAITLKQEICSILSHHNLNIQNVRGQGYDGASNMRREWNGLQALICQECPYEYYVHCLAHQLQLALIAAAREVTDAHAFFQNLTFIVNVVCSSSKRNDELQAIYTNKIVQLVANDEIETGRGMNQISTLQRPGDTRWSSHFNSICSLLRMFSATALVLEDLVVEGSTYSQRENLSPEASATCTHFQSLLPIPLHLPQTPNMVVVVANTWGVSQAISSTTTQLRPPSCFDFYPNKPPTFLLGTWGYPLQTTLSVFCRRNRSHLHHCCRCTSNTNNTSLNWDWNRWCRHFSEIEQAENFASVLKFQLEDAIEKEDFHEAAKLKRAIEEATSKDSVAEIMSQLKNAIDDERYHDASKLCRYTGSGLVGWWVGYSKDSDNPFGRIIHIGPGMGRFVGKSYSPRQLITASTGTPIFEIYVVKNADDTYHMQVVYLRGAKGNSMGNPPSIPAKSPSKPEVENASSVDVQEHEEKVERNDEKNSNIEGATEEGIKSVINFLKEKIPGLKVKVMNINVAEEVAEDNDSIKELMEEDGNKTSSSENPEGEINNLDEPDGVTLGGDSDATEEEKDLDMKLFIGGVVHDNEDTPVKDEFVRLPAEIKDMERDSFVFHIPRRNLDHDMREQKMPNIKVAALAAQGVSELMPPDVAKAFWSSDKVSSKVSKSVREIVKLAIIQAQKRSRLSEDTYFSRITSARGDFDPFDGLYVGAFGPYGFEVVQLRRKFGHWNPVENENNPSDMEFFEYVEAVKLTGDLNVPAGQVTFRAKIGRGNRNTNRGMYPDELGVVANYNGQGRIAEFGFRNPKWVDGELLQLNGKGMGPYMKGADLGFLYVVPEQSFLVVFNRLKLPE